MKQIMLSYPSYPIHVKRLLPFDIWYQTVQRVGKKVAGVQTLRFKTHYLSV